MLLPKFGIAQDSAGEIIVTANFQQQSLSSIFEAIEKDHPVHFYFKAEELPDRTFSGTYNEAKLDFVLNDLMKETLMSYFFYRKNSIIIGQRRIIDQVYSANYYQALENNNANEIDESENKDIPLIVGDINKLKPSGIANFKGQVFEPDGKETVVGATVLLPDLNKGTATDADGNFEFDVPVGKHIMIIKYIGFSDFTKSVTVNSDGFLEIKLSSGSVELDEIVVEARSADNNVESAQIGVARISMADIKKLPSFMGEADIVRSLLLQPGVSTIGEGATGFNVRGGEVDQNLVAQDGGFIFNASHALGFFSTFNADLIRDVALYKGNIPAQFGGRLSSVLDVEMKDGNFEQFKIKAGIGPVSSKIMFETPIVKKKSSIIAGFRSTYSDWILDRVEKVPEVQNSSAFFYDANFKFTQKIKEKNTLSISLYATEDDFIFNQEFGFAYSTYMGSLILKNIFTEKLYNRLTITASEYNSTQTDFIGIDASTLDNKLSYLKFKEHLTYNNDKGLTIDAGLSSIYYKTQPGTLSPFGDESVLLSKTLEDEQGIESAAFLNAEWTVSPEFLITGGLRASLYNSIGPKTVFQYQNEEFPDEQEIIDTTLLTGTLKSYFTPEPRLSMRYRLTPEISIKAGYSRTAQYINQISNTDSPTPTSLWQLSTPRIEPTRSHNFSAGYFQNFKDNNIETSFELFYRNIDNLLEYKDFANLTANNHLETELLEGIGRAYGAEISLKKKRGKVNGTLSYTLSRTERQVVGINKDDWYPSNYDKLHDFSLVVNYELNKRNNFAFNFIYASGRPTTPPIGGYRTPLGTIIPVYSDRNQVRIPDYHRLDISYTIGKGYRTDKKFKTSWTFSVYNFYARKNAFSVYYTQTPLNGTKVNRLAILGSVFPAITFNIETNY